MNNSFNLARSKLQETGEKQPYNQPDLRNEDRVITKKVT